MTIWCKLLSEGFKPSRNIESEISHLLSLPVHEIIYPAKSESKPGHWTGFSDFRDPTNSWARFLGIYPIFPELATEVAEYIASTTGLEIDSKRIVVTQTMGGVGTHSDARFTDFNTRLHIGYRNSNASKIYTSHHKLKENYVRNENSWIIPKDGDLFIMRTDTLHEVESLDKNTVTIFFTYIMFEDYAKVLEKIEKFRNQ